jgi:hypothetical protein
LDCGLIGAGRVIERIGLIKEEAEHKQHAPEDERREHNYTDYKDQNFALGEPGHLAAPAMATGGAATTLSRAEWLQLGDDGRRRLREEHEHQRASQYAGPDQRNRKPKLHDVSLRPEG